MVCDLDHQLVYLNRCAVRTAETFEPELRSAFGIGLGQLLFGSIPRFHEDPARIERILRDPRNFPYRGSFRFAGIELLGDVNAITGDDGSVIGYCVAWRDVTEQERVAGQLAEASPQLSSLGDTQTDRAAATSQQAGVAADAVAAATERIGQLSLSSQEIGSVAQLFSGIAAQTNLLALNATIEAAAAQRITERITRISDGQSSAATSQAETLHGPVTRRD